MESRIERYLIGRSFCVKKIVKLQVLLKVEFEDARGINCCETKKSQKIILHDLDLTGTFE